MLSRFCTEELMSQMEIEIIGVPGQYEKTGALGFCSISDDHFGSGKRIPTWFTIELDTEQNFIQFFIVLCHELVHVKQYARNELGIDDYDPDASLNPADFPYEKEAYELQEILLREYQMRQR